MSEEAVVEAPQEPVEVEAAVAAAEPAAAEPAPAEPAPVERSWAAVKAREKSFIESRKKFEAERADFDKARSTAASPKDYSSFIDPSTFKDDPLKVLEAHGFGLEDLQNRVLNDGAPSPGELIRRNATASTSQITEAKEEIAQLREEISSQRNQRLIDDYQNDIASTLNSEEFGLLKAYPQASNMVFNLASSYAAENNEILTAKDAAVRIQGELEEQLRELAKNPAVQRVLGLAGTSEELSAQATPQAASNPSQTLKNTMSASPAVPLEATPAQSEYESLLRVRDRLRANTGG
tara:strand:- start:3249 stop:4127 length:879 start_codon:yes stop_codon:yes gene_type:complete